MSNSNGNNASNSGISFCSLLGIVFIVLKLCGVIDWSWWLVTLPLWGGLVIGIVLVLFAFMIGMIKELKE